MSAGDTFARATLDCMQEVAPVKIRKMFGGYGIFHHGLMIALIADNELYLKVDAISRAEFEREDLPAFEYQKTAGRRVRMSYHLAPACFFEDTDCTAHWTRLAVDAARRASADGRRSAKP